ncbi:MAG: hypothetical protein C0469_00330 [Cyanobacteria bacterium DS2.3.42]|nr:hypothetical protein [Cyanobacteria bacterium DS2.3.42]
MYKVKVDYKAKFMKNLNEEHWFWKIIQEAIPANESCITDIHQQKLEKQLQELTDEELLQFHRTFERMTCIAYTEALWNAGTIISGGMGDDDFSNFRSALVASGKEVFEDAVENPESLVAFQYSERLVDNSMFNGPVHTTYARRQGEARALKELRYEKLPELNSELLVEDQEVLKRLFPGLFDKFWKRST